MPTARSEPASARPPAAFVAVDAPWGPIHVAATDGGIVALELLTPEPLFVASLERRLRAEVNPAGSATEPRIRELLTGMARAIERYLGGDGIAFDGIPLDLQVGSAWDRRILDGVRRIPYGTVTSYGRLAGLVGSRGAARAAGGAVGRNPIGLLIPCHRVIAGDGSIGGYGGAWWGGRDQLLAIKRELLAREGVALPATAFVG
ncbi:MAG TPA: methylated-DNA--[protein]-cysteine S-methyltransferase [Candidatus Binatia bacterium]|nr:methylated-DNA--[protein]-cysteine S-methyltransferase [Candidatus Binatia bacterium]